MRPEIRELILSSGKSADKVIGRQGPLVVL